MNKHFKTLAGPKNYLDGVVWLIKHEFIPQDKYPFKVFKGTFKIKPDHLEDFSMTVLWHSLTKTWEIKLSRSQYGKILTELNPFNENEPIEGSGGDTIQNALKGIVDRVDEALKNMRLQIVNPDMYKGMSFWKMKNGE